MSLLGFKSVSAILILAITILSGLLTLHLTNREQRILQIADAGANGIFIGAALFHLLPEAFQQFETLHFPHFRLDALALAVMGFLLLVILEKLVVGKKHSLPRSARINTLLLLGLLGIHSFITGATLGISATFAAGWIILIAIIAHKGCESFALMNNMRKSQYHSLGLRVILMSFATITPIGILFGQVTSGILANYSSEVLTAVFSAFATGTFLYIGSKHSLHTHQHREDSYSQWQHMMASLSGMLAMGIIAVWV